MFLSPGQGVLFVFAREREEEEENDVKQRSTENRPDIWPILSGEEFERDKNVCNNLYKKRMENEL
ncbi:hypothetical protein OUZ56_024903 [Daphnia magna]|uniref:Uncharacterized protein n=1 Tax=Daphnia magna TaxID=35525 RepID=A0ABQ9ZJR9_9CRUS|nr:hypothetical protein OUZ56_024903 [Daphnia magna]